MVIGSRLHWQKKLYEMHVLPRIVRFGLICGNDLVKYICID